MTTAGPSISRHSPHPHPTQSYHQHYRHHPYAPPSNNNAKTNSSSSSLASSSSSRQQQQQPRLTPNNVNGNGELPPSPPRSRRDNSETPSIGLGVAFGGSSGGKWWDEELPPPPASLSSILDSFRKSGEGDRELLLSILGAKKAEEERLTALIQTRLTVLQARLSLHSTAASLPPSMTAPSPVIENGSNSMTTSPLQNQNNMAPPLPVERTPSLTSSRGAGSTSSSGMPSPPLPQQHNYVQHQPNSFEKNLNVNEKENSTGSRGYWQLPSLQSSLRVSPQQPQSINILNNRSPNSPSGGLPLAPIREVRLDEKRSNSYNTQVQSGNNRRRSIGSLSPKSTGSDSKRSSSGLEMLLDAGRVVNESSERDQ